MSVAAERSHSPNHFGHKRHFERTDSTEYQLSNENRSKRSRRRSSSSSDLGDLPQKGAPSDRASTLVALRGLFPNMEEKVRLQLISRAHVQKLSRSTATCSWPELSVSTHHVGHFQRACAEVKCREINNHAFFSLHRSWRTSWIRAETT